MEKKNFLIISVNDKNAHPPGSPSFSEIAEITSKSLISYAQKNGYFYAIQDSGLDETRPISWSKVFLARKYLENPALNFALCWDSDVFVVNEKIKLEDFVDEDHDVFITAYQNNIEHLNTGAIIYRNSPWTRDFLKKIYDDPEFIEPRPNCFFEQSSIISFYKKNPHEQKHFKFLPVRSINSHFHEGFSDPKWDVNYKIGDLAIHAAGTENFFRLETFKGLEKCKESGGLPENFNVKMWNR